MKDILFPSANVKVAGIRLQAGNGESYSQCCFRLQIMILEMFSSITDVFYSSI